MGETTGISWATHTFNPWWGCVEVGGSPACGPTAGYKGAPCYAKVWDARTGGNHWGADADRRFFSDKHWGEPLKWNKAAEKAGVSARVFCMSMGDWAEGRPDQRGQLERLWDLIDATPWLDWMMLTKRPQLIPTLYPQEWQRNPLKNVWMGTTTETQFWLDNRWEFLKRINAVVHWLSIEPMFERIVLPADFLALGRHGWVITGGQSGGAAVPMHPDWPRAIRDQCVSAGVAYHHKQNGEWSHKSNFASFPEWDKAASHALVFPDGKFSVVGGRDKPDPEFGLRTCDLDGNDGAAAVARIGKKEAGRNLDGVVWNEFPSPLEAA